jgi:hypothetical protein
MGAALGGTLQLDRPKSAHPISITTPMRLAGLLFTCLPFLAQPSASSVTKAPGDMVTLRIFANSQPAKAPAGLKWELIFPAQLMDLDGKAEIGDSATDSNKSLQCTLAKSYRYSCILSGGKGPIADGQIAMFRFRIRTTAERGKTSLRIERAVAIAADGKEEPLTGTESIIVIR